MGAVINVSYQKNRTEYGNQRDISLVVHPGKVNLKVSAYRPTATARRRAYFPANTTEFAPVIDSRLDAGRAPATGVSAEERDSIFRVVDRPAECVRRRRSRAAVARVRTLRSARQDYRRHPTIPRRHTHMHVVDYGKCSDLFDAKKGVPREHVLVPLLFTTFVTAVLGVVSRRHSDDVKISSDLVYLHEPPVEGATEGSGEPAHRLAEVLRADGDMLYAYNFGIVCAGLPGVQFPRVGEKD